MRFRMTRRTNLMRPYGYLGMEHTCPGSVTWDDSNRAANKGKRTAVFDKRWRYTWTIAELSQHHDYHYRVSYMQQDIQRYAGLELFIAVDLNAIESHLARCHEMTVAAGEVLLETGKPNDNLYLVLAGALQVHLRSLSKPPLIELGPGTCAGELSILSQLEAAAHVAAIRDSTLLVIPEDVLWSMINVSHGIACNLLYILSGRIRQDNDRYYQCWHATRQFAHFAMVDALTGLPNRRWLDEVLERQHRRCQKDGTPLTAIMLDVDNFKKFNDSHGHLAGDKALATLSSILRRHTRPTDLAARFGGEEFLIMMPGVGLTDALRICERLREDVASNPVEIGEGRDPVRMTISLGVAEDQPGSAATALIEAADNRLYEAKSGGRNRVAPASLEQD